MQPPKLGSFILHSPVSSLLSSQPAYDSLCLHHCSWALFCCFIERAACRVTITPLKPFLRYLELGLIFACGCSFAITITIRTMQSFTTLTFLRDGNEGLNYDYYYYTTKIYLSYIRTSAVATVSTIIPSNHGNCSILLRRQSKISRSDISIATQETSFLSINPCPAITILSHGPSGTSDPKILSLYFVVFILWESFAGSCDKYIYLSPSRKVTD